MTIINIGQTTELLVLTPKLLQFPQKLFVGLPKLHVRLRSVLSLTLGELERGLGRLALGTRLSDHPGHGVHGFDVATVEATHVVVSRRQGLGQVSDDGAREVGAGFGGAALVCDGLLEGGDGGGGASEVSLLRGGGGGERVVLLQKGEGGLLEVIALLLQFADDLRRVSSFLVVPLYPLRSAHWLHSK